MMSHLSQDLFRTGEERSKKPRGPRGACCGQRPPPVRAYNAAMQLGKRPSAPSRSPGQIAVDRRIDANPHTPSREDAQPDGGADHGTPRRRGPVSLDDVRAALCTAFHDPYHAADEGDVEIGRVAAVAAILRHRDGEAQLLFIRRAKHPGDPWSGHMAWPGGKREACDPDMLACAVRETREEVGVDLTEAGELLGRLRGWRRETDESRDSDSAAGRDGRLRLRAVHAFVFGMTADVEPQPGDEVQEAVWIPLSYFTDWKARFPWSWAARWLPVVPPAYRYDGHLIWGLTQWMLADLLRRLAAGPHPRGTPGRSR